MVRKVQSAKTFDIPYPGVSPTSHGATVRRSTNEKDTLPLCAPFPEMVETRRNNGLIEGPRKTKTPQFVELAGFKWRWLAEGVSAHSPYFVRLSGGYGQKVPVRVPGKLEA